MGSPRRKQLTDRKIEQIQAELADLETRADHRSHPGRPRRAPVQPESAASPERDDERLEPRLEMWTRRPPRPGRVEGRNLSCRQRQVAIGLWAGLTVLQIAHELGLSFSTVDHYRATLYSRLDVHSREEFLREIEKMRLQK
jgi:DNA-binding NarL/FixJ family response regulator